MEGAGKETTTFTISANAAFDWSARAMVVGVTAILVPWMLYKLPHRLLFSSNPPMILMPGMVMAFALAFLPGLFRATTITVGRGAVRIRRFRERVIPYDVIVEASAREFEARGGIGWAVEVEIGKEGERVRILMGKKSLEPIAKEIARRISEAVDAWDKADAEPEPAIDPAVPLLARGDRSMADWLRALREIEHPTFRSAAIDMERLLAIVADARVTLEGRAAAAIALAANTDPALRERVRVAVEEIDDAKLHAVFDAAVADDEAALEESLNAIKE